jgi:hypothetical protein
LFSQGRAAEAADDLARSVEAGEKYRMTSILLNTGIAQLSHERADKSSYFAFAEPYLPISLNAILFLDAARTKAGNNGSDEFKKNFGDIEFALRPIGSLQSAKLVRWPIPIVRFYLDEIGYVDLLAQAEKMPKTSSVSPVCTANLFAGIHTEKGVDSKEIEHRLRYVADNCPASSLEYALASAELHRISQ